MKKIKPEDFLCIDFVNSEPQVDKVIKGLIKSFIDSLRVDGVGPDERLLALRWEKIVRSNIGRLVDTKKTMDQFIRYSILKAQSGSGTGPEMDKDLHRIRHFLRNEGEKYYDPKYDDGDIYNKKDFNVVKNLMIPGLCKDLIDFDEKNYWDRMKYCSECKKVFVTKTRRVQNFCSDRCRFRYHNRERIKSGNHKIYMRNWREKIERSSVNTQI